MTLRPIIDVRAFRSLIRQLEENVQAQSNRCCTGVTVSQCHALLEIERLGNTSIGQLAETLGLDNSTVSRTVDGLVSMQLVERAPDRRDRRYVVIALSEKGRETCRQYNAESDQYYQGVLEAIPQADRQRVIDAFTAFVNAMSTYREGMASNAPDVCPRG